MIKKIISGLDDIARCVKGNSEIEKARKAIEAAASAVRETHGKWNKDSETLIQELENELSVWQTKLPVIFNEPAGRQGMAKHAKHWVEKLRTLCQMN